MLRRLASSGVSLRAVKAHLHIAAHQSKASSGSCWAGRVPTETMSYRLPESSLDPILGQGQQDPTGAVRPPESREKWPWAGPSLRQAGPAQAHAPAHTPVLQLHKLISKPQAQAPVGSEGRYVELTPRSHPCLQHPEVQGCRDAV